MSSVTYQEVMSPALRRENLLFQVEMHMALEKMPPTLRRENLLSRIEMHMALEKNMNIYK